MVQQVIINAIYKCHAAAIVLSQFTTICLKTAKKFENLLLLKNSEP
jgi:hypothetical protein